MERNGRVGGRVVPPLAEQTGSGIETGADAEFAPANALDEKFPEAFKAARGAVDPDLKLGF